MILGNSKENGDVLDPDSHFLPATGVTHISAVRIFKYIFSTKEPMAYIFPGTTVLNTKPAPTMAIFTSRGPNTISPDILKVSKDKFPIPRLRSFKLPLRIYSNF